MIVRGGPGIAFLNCLTNVNKLPDFLPVWWDEEKLNIRVMVPICFPSQGNCLGVQEFTLDESKNRLGVVLLDTVKALKVRVCGIQQNHIKGIAFSSTSIF
ncbi:hypothetical protein Hanom_Chr02g00144071 [Helianthus anomalus]